MGIINIESYNSFAFTQNQLHYIEALAEQAARAIRNAQAYTTQSKERRQAGLHVRQLSRLSEISRAFRANMSLMFVEMMSGEIWLKSELKVGSTFSFTLPSYNLDKSNEENEVVKTLS